VSDRRDPTRSAGLRRHGRALVNRRLFSLHQALRQGLQDHDVLGLRVGETKGTPAAFINWMESVAHKLARAEDMIEHVIEQTVLAPQGWPDELITRSVERGIELVEGELRTSLIQLDASEVSTLHMAEVASEVRGIAGETQRRMVRHVVRALEVKARPEDLMREVRATLEKITKLRLHLMINTSVVRAVNAGKLFAYEAEGIAKVGVDPEWIPADRQHDHAAGHHHRDSSLHLDAPRTRKAKRRARVARNKAKRTRKRTVEELLVEGIAANVFEEQSGAIGNVLEAAGFAKRALEVIEAAEEEEEVLVSVLTAGDDKVCQDCEDIAADGPYEIGQARGLIPAHPNCRCAFIPWGDKRYAPIMEQEEEWE
jgi:hypothetical protein